MAKYCRVASIKNRKIPSEISTKIPSQNAGIQKKLPISEKKFSRTESNLIYAGIVRVDKILSVLSFTN